MKPVVLKFVLFYFIICIISSSANNIPQVIFEPHHSSKTKNFLNSQKEEILTVIKTYSESIVTLPQLCHAKRFMFQILHIDNIPGNNQDLAIALVQTLSLDIEDMLNSLIDTDPNNLLKIKGAFMAAKAHDMLLESLKLTERMMGTVTGTLNIK